MLGTSAFSVRTEFSVGTREELAVWSRRFVEDADFHQGQEVVARVEMTHLPELATILFLDLILSFIGEIGDATDGEAPQGTDVCFDRIEDGGRLHLHSDGLSVVCLNPFREFGRFTYSRSGRQVMIFGKDDRL